jgi:hypothetical protein
MGKPINEISGIEREKWITRNKYYYQYLVTYLKYFIPENASILQIGSGTGYLLEALNPRWGVGVTNSPSQYDYAREHRPQNTYHLAELEEYEVDGVFDFILISDSIGSFHDVQKVFEQVRSNCDDHTRIVFTTVNFLWYPLLNLAESIGLKMPQKKQNWLDKQDIINILTLAGFETVSQSRSLIAPLYVPFISDFFNTYIGPLPLINRLGLVNFVTARKVPELRSEPQAKSVSVIIPARNEKGNIESLILRTPKMGSHTEIIFVEGNSTDDTWAEIQRIAPHYLETHDIKWVQQEGKGKGDAVRKGFATASCDILMILDADMTVPPEDLTKFYNAIASGKGEFINGTRLVYPMEEEAMRFLNLLGNKFFSLAFSWILGQSLKDTLCGTKVISAVNYQKLIKNRHYFGNFDPFGDFDLIFGAAKLQLKIIEVPIRYRARTYGETNISRFRHGWILIKMTFFALSKIKFISRKD